MPPTPIKKVKKKAIWDDEDVLKLTKKKATVIALPAASLAAAVEAADDDAPPKKKAAAPKKKRVAAAEEESAEGKPRSAKRVKRAPAPAPASDDSVTDDEQQQQQLQQHAAAYDEMLRREAEEEPGDEEADDSLGDDARDDARLAVSKFNLSAETVQALRNRGVEALFPIQAACFDHLNAGKDLIGRARTGMGKTLAFALPLVEKVLALRKQTGTMRRPGRKPMGLVMAPTRELAQQVASEVQSVAPGLESYCVYGGTPMGPSCTALRAGLDLVIGTPGRIKDLAERTKIDLSSRTEAPFSIPFVTMTPEGTPLDINMVITRKLYEELTDSMVKRTIEIADMVIKDAGITVGQLDEILLVGGQTRWPAVQKAVLEFFGKPPAKSVHPDEAVAIGAALYAHSLETDNVDQKVQLLDVIPMAIGIERADSKLHEIFKRNASVPNQKSLVFTTSEDGQEELVMRIYQGDHQDEAQKNELLGEFTFSGIRKGTRGSVKVEVIFDCNVEGILSMSAQDKDTGKQMKTTVKVTAAR